MIFTSTHGNGESDIYVSGQYELIRLVLGFEIERVTIIYQGTRVHQIEAQDGLTKAQAWCREHARLAEPVPELDLPGWDANGSEQR